MINKESIVIPSDVNLASLSNIEDIDNGSDARIWEIIATLSFRLAGVVNIQSWTPAYKDSVFYVAIYARIRGVVGGVPYHFGKGGG